MSAPRVKDDAAVASVVAGAIFVIVVAVIVRCGCLDILQFFPPVSLHYHVARCTRKLKTRTLFFGCIDARGNVRCSTIRRLHVHTVHERLHAHTVSSSHRNGHQPAVVRLTVVRRLIFVFSGRLTATMTPEQTDTVSVLNDDGTRKSGEQIREVSMPPYRYPR